MEPRPQEASGRRQDKVIRFAETQRSTPYDITQRDLAEERLFTIEAASALRRLQSKRQRIRRAIQNGAKIEPGLRSALLIEIEPKPYSANPKPYTKLVIK